MRSFVLNSTKVSKDKCRISTFQVFRPEISCLEVLFAFFFIRESRSETFVPILQNLHVAGNQKRRYLFASDCSEGRTSLLSSYPSTHAPSCHMSRPDRDDPAAAKCERTRVCTVASSKTRGQIVGARES